MIHYKKYTALCAFFFFVNTVLGYGLPGVNLGFTNILDGGPVRPYPGIYWQQFAQYYSTKRFLNEKGKPLGGVPSPRLRLIDTIIQFVYQFKYEMPLRSMPGFTIVLPIILYSKIEDNVLGIKSSGSGVSNLSFGAFLQWRAIELKGRPFFIHRLNFDFAIPLGKNELPEKQINPNDPFFFCGPSWSATMYLSHRWALSCRLNYLWNAQNEKIDFRAGDVVFSNYSLEYEAYPNFYIAAVGYALQQLHNNRAAGVTIPDSKERVFGVGPGVAYFFSKDIYFFSYLYLEAGVRNRTQGTSFITRVLMHF